MNKPNPFKPDNSNGLPAVGRCRLFLLLQWTVCFLVVYISPIMETKGQYAYAAEDENAILTFDELLVTTYLEATWSFNTHMLISNSNSLYIRVEDLFKNLEIPYEVVENGDKLEGFIGNERKAYSLDFGTKKIKVGSKTTSVVKELLKENGALYLESSAMAKAFGLHVAFNHRSLSAKLTSDFELPKTKQIRLEKTRRNISKLRGEQVAVDTVLKRNYHLFRFGTMDWGFAMSQSLQETSSNSFSLGLGTELLYGEVNASAYYDSRYEMDKRQIRYNWRWIDNDRKLIRQAQLGNIYNSTIATVNSPVIGASIRNSPTTVRKASGFYNLNEYTDPNWTVELYINDVLVDFTTADASGLFAFKVPVVYGYTTLKLKFYGPLGEERTDERTMNVPFTFMPANTFEYGLSGGVLQDDNKSRFGKVDFDYGINRFLTVGGGMEYLSSIPNNPFIPFAKIAFQPFSKLIVNLQYAHGVRLKGLLNYYFNQSSFLEIDWAKYVMGQSATQFSALEERKVMVSVPYKKNKITGFAKANFNQFIYQPFVYNQFDIMFSAHCNQFSANSSSLLNWVSKGKAYVSTNFSLSYKMKSGLVFRPSAQYDLQKKNFMIVRTEIEKRFAKAYFSLSYERNVASRNDNLYFSFRYDLPFARANVSASYSNDRFRFSENAQGSLAFGGKNGFAKAGYNSSLGKGGILFYPFFDLNHNGIFDKGEKMVLLTRVKISGGSATIGEKDSIVRVSDLNAFVDYNVDFTDLDLDNIAWRFKYKRYRVLVDPNQYKSVYVPIVSVGEVSGMVHLNRNNTLEGIKRILVKFYKKNSTAMVAEILSESDGYINYVGLEPGAYVARIDSAQLNNLNFEADPPQIDFTINTTEQGDLVEGLNFVLRQKPSDSLKEQENAQGIDGPDSPKKNKGLPVSIKPDVKKNEN